MMLGNKVPVMMGTRERCNHNLRFRLQGKSNICLICQCNKIDDLLGMECGGNRKMSSEAISEIIHQFRIINSVLEAPIEEKYVEALLSPVLRTSVALLKIHNDEVGAVVAQALDKISPKVPISMVEDFLEKLSAQILEKISYGNLDCLAVLIQKKECLNSFLKRHGSMVLPKLFQLLEHHVSTVRCVSAITSTQLAECNKENQTRAGFVPPSSTAVSGRESLKIVEKLLEVIDANCPSDVCLVVESNTTTTANAEDNEHEGSYSEQKQPFLPSQQAFLIFAPYLKELILACMNLLGSSEILRMTKFTTKILNFLEKLCHYPGALRCLFSDRTGMKLFSNIKTILYTHNTEIKTAALQLVNRMVLTYKYVMEEGNADKTFIADLPNAISEVDLIHFISEAMNTSCEILFRVAIQLLDQINGIPQFRLGRMIPVLESALRISAMHIPDNITASSTYISLNSLILNILTSLGDGIPPSGIQRQLIYLFEKLPTKWSALQYLSWIKLLLFCTEGELQENLWPLFRAFVQRSKNSGGSCSYVVQLKCVLLIAYTLMKCKCPQGEAEHGSLACLFQQHQPQQQLSQEELIKQLMHFLMDPSFVPTITALVRYGTAEDSLYITTLLELLKYYPAEYLSTRYSQTSFEQEVSQAMEVTFGSETVTEALEQENQDAVYEITVDQSSTIKINDVCSWSAKFYMQILAAIRLNPEFMMTLHLFDLWNENVAKIISVCYPLYLPQLKNACGNNSTFGGESNCDTNNSHFDQRDIKQILGKLDIDALTWAKVVGQYDFVSNGIRSLEKRKHDMILAFYFCFALFAGKDVMQFIDDDFIARYATFLEECVGQYEMTQDGNMEKEFDWTQMSYHFRVALMIATAIPQDDVAPISDKFEVLLLEVEEAGPRFCDEILICHCDAFVLVIKWKLLSGCVSLIERWLREDRNGCILFYSRGNFDEQFNADITNSLLDIAAEGDKETSTMAVELACRRRKNFVSSYQVNCVKGKIHDLYNQILFHVDEEKEETKEQNSLTLLRLSNVIQMAIDDDCFFNSGNKFPTDFLHQVVRVMLNFNGVSMIGKRCLELISKILGDHNVFQNVNPYLITHREFINFLGSRLNISNMDNITESIFAYKLLTLLIRHNLEKFSSTSATSVQGPPWIQWKLTSIFSHLHLVPKIEILDLDRKSVV